MQLYKKILLRIKEKLKNKQNFLKSLNQTNDLVVASHLWLGLSIAQAAPCTNLP